MKMKNNNLSRIIWTMVIMMILMAWGIVGLKCLLLTIGIFSLLFYINIVTTTLGNAFIGRDIDMNYDIFWKILFIIISSLSFGIYFSL